MSKHHVSYTHLELLKNLQTMSKQDLEDLYGIEIGADESVYDPCEMRTFVNLREWAAFVVEQEVEDNYSSFQKINHKRHFDDDLDY